jgi:hypothetical protein
VAEATRRSGENRANALIKNKKTIKKPAKSPTGRPSP